MAIKRLRLNDEGEFEERTLEKSEIKAPPPPPPKAKRKARISASAPASSGGGGKNSRVVVKKTATKRHAAGKTVLDVGVVRYGCGRCDSSRVFNEKPEKPPTCGMCSVAMQLQR